MRWDRLFDDLEAQLAHADAEEFAAEVSDRTRREVATVALLDRFRSAIGTRIELAVEGAGAVSGVVRRVGPGWLLVEPTAHPALVVTGHAVLAVRGLPLAASDPATLSAIDSRLDFAHVMRAVARDRAEVTLRLRDESSAVGTVDRVGADFLDLAEHAVGEPRRAATVRGLRTVTFGAISLVRLT